MIFFTMGILIIRKFWLTKNIFEVKAYWTFLKKCRQKKKNQLIFLTTSFTVHIFENPQWKLSRICFFEKSKSVADIFVSSFKLKDTVCHVSPQENSDLTIFKYSTSFESRSNKKINKYIIYFSGANWEILQCPCQIWV